MLPPPVHALLLNHTRHRPRQSFPTTRSPSLRLAARALDGRCGGGWPGAGQRHPLGEALCYARCGQAGAGGAWCWAVGATANAKRHAPFANFAFVLQHACAEAFCSVLCTGSLVQQCKGMQEPSTAGQPSKAHKAVSSKPHPVAKNARWLTYMPINMRSAQCSVRLHSGTKRSLCILHGRS